MSSHTATRTETGLPSFLSPLCEGARGCAVPQALRGPQVQTVWGEEPGKGLARPGPWLHRDFLLLLPPR